MRAQLILKFIPLCGLALAMSLTSAQAQTATWIGPATGDEWNTTADWDIGVPGVGISALIGPGTNVNYNTPMAAASFGILTNNGVLNINTSGFNCTGIALTQPTGGDKLFLNNGAAVTVNGNVTLATNASVTMTVGSSLSINGALDVAFGSSSKASGTCSFTNSGGMLMANSTAVNNNSGTANGLLVITGGTNNLGNTIVGRSSSSSFATLGNEGLILYNGLNTISNLNVGNNGTGNSYLTALIANGIVTNFGSVYVNQGTGGRASRLLQTGGLFVVPDPSVVNPNGYGAATAPSSAVVNIYSVTGGTNIVGGFYFGNSNATALATINFTNGSVIYIGSQGIASNGAATINASLNNGGTFGATAPWTGNAPMKLSGGIFNFQTADMNGNPNDITLAGPLSGAGALNKTGGGTLTVNAADTFLGNTIINAGALAIGPSGSLASPFIFVNAGATYDVSQATSYTVIANQVLAGLGTVNGAVNVASSGIVYPGSNSITGTLTLQGNLIETGGAVNEFQLSGNPSGPGNDFLMASGGLTISGANTILINGAVQPGGIYPLISYSGGTFSGSIANFAISGAGGTLSNSATAQAIYFIAQSSVRAATNITWVGSVANNNWDTEVTSNWLNNGTGQADFFVPEDNVLFANIEKTNQVNIVGAVTPSSITVSTTTNYTFIGGGSIGGQGNLTVNSGTLNILTTNNYIGATILDGGVLAVPFIANSGIASSIGSASSSPANLVFGGGTLAYTGPSTSTDHGITLTNGGGIIDVTNGTALTLNGSIVGNGPLTATDSGTLILNNVNSYTNTTTIAAGRLQLNNANGAGSGVINFSNGTLVYYPSGGITVPNPFNFVAGTSNTIVVTSGSGGNPISSGNWTGGGVVLVNNSYNPYTVNGNLDGFTGTILLGPNNVALRFNSGGGNSCTGSTNATFDLGTGSGQLTDRNGGIMNLGGLAGGPYTEVVGQDADSGTTTWTIGWNNLNTTFNGSIVNDNSTRVSALTKVGTGTLTFVGGVITNISSPDGGLTFDTNLLATNLLVYTGNTTVSNGTLALIVPDALTTSPIVTLASPTATIDASLMGYVDDTGTNLFTNSIFEVVSGQTLNGIGTIRGILQADAGSIFNVGLPTGTFNVTSNASLSGTVNMSLNGASSSELAAQTFTLTNSTATLFVTNTGPGIVTGTTFTLFNHGVPGFTSVTLPPTDPTGLTNYVWANNIASSGTITLTSGGVAPSGPKIGFTVNGNTLSLSWATAGYTLQVQTNSLTVGISTNWVNVPGSASVTSTNITINPSSPSVFFRLHQ